MTHTYDYPRPAVTTDAVIFSTHTGEKQVLLIQRRHDPYRDHWALPGGFLDEDEDPELGVARELEEETSLTGVPLHQLGFWGRPGREPRGHTVSLVYWAIVDGSLLNPAAADDASRSARGGQPTEARASPLCGAGSAHLNPQGSPVARSWPRVLLTAPSLSSGPTTRG